MRNEDEAKGIVAQVGLEPGPRFQVKVVGRLIEQKQVGFREQQLCQRDTHLPAAGELLSLPLPVGLREAEAAQHRTDLRIERVAIVRVEAGAER